MRPGSERVVLDGRPLVRDLDYRDRLRPRTHRVHAPGHAVRGAAARRRALRGEPASRSAPTTLAGFVSELPVSHGMLDFHRDQSVAEHVVQSRRSSAFRAARRSRPASPGSSTGTRRCSRSSPAGCRSATPKPRRTFLVQAEIASSHPQFARAQSGHGVRRDVRRRRRHLDRARRHRVVTTAACRRTATRSRPASAERSSSRIARGDARLADERPDVRPDAGSSFAQRQIDPLLDVRRQRDRAQRAGAVAHAAAARPGRPLRPRVTQLRLDRQRPRRGGLAPVSVDSHGAQLRRASI